MCSYLMADDANVKSKKILLHVCCAPCAVGCIDSLIERNYCITLFYSNSNIFPKEEYEKRLKYVFKLAKILNIDVIEGTYDHLSWLRAVKGLENEPERGKRCTNCFDFNLKRTASIAHELKIPYFTTTLTLSPHKISGQIFNVGENYQGYIPFDFKKGNGNARSSILSKEFDIYRQRYCGCEFSLKQSLKKEIKG
jgi:predicted adenine nucleotide alpha hydrolase (AANH) superfamily ATPase